eukprot:768047-Hanusia_phi.AAC.1
MNLTTREEKRRDREGDKMKEIREVRTSRSESCEQLHYDQEEKEKDRTWEAQDPTCPMLAAAIGVSSKEESLLLQSSPRFSCTKLSFSSPQSPLLSSPLLSSPLLSSPSAPPSSSSAAGQLASAPPPPSRGR